MAGTLVPKTVVKRGAHQRADFLVQTQIDAQKLVYARPFFVGRQAAVHQGRTGHKAGRTHHAQQQRQDPQDTQAQAVHTGMERLGAGDRGVLAWRSVKPSSKTT